MKEVSSTPNASQTDKPKQLDAGERLFLWGFRTIAEHRRCEHPVIPAIQNCYRQFRIERAAPSIDAIVDAFFHTAHTPIAIHSARCPCVSDEEAFLLRAMASAQFKDAGAARRQFERWLPVQAAEWILGPVSEVGRLFHIAGLCFCWRDADKSKVAEAREPIWPAVSRAVH
jgi:hypothetical protein